jgi:hypothetical protein
MDLVKQFKIVVAFVISFNQSHEYPNRMYSLRPTTITLVI